MNPQNYSSQQYKPILLTKSDVFKFAHENKNFFNSFGECLIYTWRLYFRLNLN